MKYVLARWKLSWHCLWRRHKEDIAWPHMHFGELHWKVACKECDRIFGRAGVS